MLPTGYQQKEWGVLTFSFTAYRTILSEWYTLTGGCCAPRWVRSWLVGWCAVYGGHTEREVHRPFLALCSYILILLPTHLSIQYTLRVRHMPGLKTGLCCFKYNPGDKLQSWDTALDWDFHVSYYHVGGGHAGQGLYSWVTLLVLSHISSPNTV